MKDLQVSIDDNSGFCFGVVYAIQMAEDYLNEYGKLYCLGDIVHNEEEVERLKAKGLQIISHDDLPNLKHERVLIRAHGEPPQTYKTALDNENEDNPQHITQHKRQAGPANDIQGAAHRAASAQQSGTEMQKSA